MRKITLVRLGSRDEGTFGLLAADDNGFLCRTLELPWRENVRMRSCIPAGRYVFKWRADSPAHGEVYEAQDVEGRDNIQIHSANLGGDAEKGYVAQLLGCISLGKSIAKFKAGAKPAGEKDQHGVSSSRATVADFVKFMGKEPFELEVAWKEGENPEQKEV